jgi:5'-nucleotidase
LLGACATPASRPGGVTIAAINDFHGNLRPPAEGALVGGARVPAGGAAHLATLVGRLRAGNPSFAFVSAGDLVGATPLLAGHFDDEPVIESLSLMGLDYNGVGNHEFDHGLAHLRRLQEGGCPPKGCKSGFAFAGARFRMLAANVVERASGKTVFPPYGIKDYGALKVAFIGLTLRTTPTFLSPRAHAGLEFRDEVETVAALVPELERQGVRAIVVLIHQGGFAGGGANGCDKPWGPIFELAPKFHPMVRVVVSAHTHQAYICRVGDKLVTSAGAYGRHLTEITLSADGSSKAANHVVSAKLPPDAAQAALLARYGRLYEPFERVVGRLSAPLPRDANADGESPLGRVMADALLEATRGAGAVAAFMNRGGIRAPLQPAADGTITFADLYAAHPFGNTLITMPLAGAQIIRLLEQQWIDEPRVMPVSRGFSYSWDPARPPGSRVVPGSVTIDGKTLDPDAVYRVTFNDYLANGGDGLTMLREVRGRRQGGGLLDALVLHLKQNQPLSAPQDRRIIRVQ